MWLRAGGRAGECVWGGGSGREALGLWVVAVCSPHMKSKTTLVHDKHHCRCHRIHPSIAPELEGMMRSSGFEDVLQEDHGQAFGLRRRLPGREQLHVKVMPTAG